MMIIFAGGKTGLSAAVTGTVEGYKEGLGYVEGMAG